jgi:RsiW-degrading membrane proteinase PrsW (M82 family)
MTVLLASLAPVLIILFYIYFRDKYEKEPLGLLIKALLLGVVIVVPVVITERLLMNFMPQSGKVAAAAWHAFVVAGISEELFKFLALYLLIWKSPSFNEKFDGIVYAVFVSLGFAGVENVIYVLEGGMQTALIRAITAVPAHAIFGITMGYYLGIAHMYTELKGRYLLRALVVPIVLHGIYDFILMMENGWLLLLFVPYVVVLYLMGMKKMKVLSDSSIFKPLEEEEQDHFLT